MNRRILLVGNPNCGKTTLFNALTDSRQKVGNWPGVTVEKKAGWYRNSKENIEIIDLPGVYALSLPQHVSAKDEQITSQILFDNDFDLIINLVDACHLERHLYLTSQLLELGKPIVVALNMMDVAAQAGIQVDLEALAGNLNCPVVELQAHKHIGMQNLTPYVDGKLLKPSVQSAVNAYLPRKVLRHMLTMQTKMDAVYPEKTEIHLYSAYRAMEQSIGAEPVVIEDLDLLMADARYQMVHAWVTHVLTKKTDFKEQCTAKLDRLFLHRFWGLPVFFALMYGVFFLAIGVGGAIQSGFDIGSEGLFIQGPAWVLTQWHAPNWVIQLTAFGLGQACHTLLTFIPVLAIMYFLLAFLEASGYMARVAFIMDRLMRRLGLPGQAFVPMIIGFGCNVPAILAARTMQTERDRFLTVLMNPYMSCSARLAIYAVFVAAFFPTKGYLVIFSLYLLGIGMAILTGFLARATFLSGPISPLILELPTYHCPSVLRLSKEAGLRLRYFLVRAGKVILPLCLVLSLFTLESLSLHTTWHTILSQWIMPIFSPMGIQADNWPAVVALFTGMLAKEVVIGTFDNLYSQMSHLGDSWQVMAPLNLSELSQQAVVSIWEHLQALWRPTSTAQIDMQSFHTLPMQIKQHFGSTIAAYAYLLFILLYIPCVSTMAAIRQEANQRLMWFSIVWSLGLAYGAAVVFYQLATWIAPWQLMFKYAVFSIVISSGVVWAVIRFIKHGGQRACSNS